MLNFKCIDPPNFGVLQTELPEFAVEVLYNIISNSVQDCADDYEFKNNKITKLGKNHQFHLTDQDKFFENTIIKPSVEKYIQTWGIPASTKTTHWHDLEFNRFWCRITKPDHYQSLHDHNGLLSFIIWLKIPTDWKEEQTINGEQNFEHPEASDVIFTYTNTLGQIKKLNFKLDKTMEGNMVMFPSDMSHMVLPYFQTDDYRISVAGDISIASKKATEEKI